jgi:hypothetical protein
LYEISKMMDNIRVLIPNALRNVCFVMASLIYDFTITFSLLS